MKKLVALSLAGMMACSLTLAGGSVSVFAEDDSEEVAEESTEEESELHFQYFALTMAVEWLQNIENSLETLGEENNFTCSANDAGRSIDTQLNQIDTAIAAGDLDGAFLFVADEGSATAVVEKFNDAGIPVIGETMKLQDSDGNTVAPYVELDAKAVGANCGTWLVENAESYGVDLSDWNKVGVILNTSTTYSSDADRSDGFREAIEAGYPDIPADNYFTSDGSSGSSDDYSDNCNANTSAILAANPDIETWLVFGSMDSYAMGGVRALEAAGLDSNAIVVSCGGEYAVPEWKNGTAPCWKAVCYYDATDFAEYMVEGMLEIVRDGKDASEIFPEYKEDGQDYSVIKVSGNMITPDNYTDYVEE
jgi:L-arabinose transport system substrate-binding protein